MGLPSFFPFPSAFLRGKKDSSPLLFILTFLLRSGFRVTTITKKGIGYFSHINNAQLGYYLSGLLESDGTLVVPDSLSKNTPKISIVFNIKDLPLALHLKSTLGYGSIQKDEKKSAINFVVRNKSGIIDLLLLINGKFRTPKI